MDMEKKESNHAIDLFTKLSSFLRFNLQEMLPYCIDKYKMEVPLYVIEEAENLLFSVTDFIKMFKTKKSTIDKFQLEKGTIQEPEWLNEEKDQIAQFELWIDMFNKMKDSINKNKINVKGFYCGICNYFSQSKEDWESHIIFDTDHNRYYKLALDDSQSVIKVSECNFCGVVLFSEQPHLDAILRSAVHQSVHIALLSCQSTKPDVTSQLEPDVKSKISSVSLKLQTLKVHIEKLGKRDSNDLNETFQEPNINKSRENKPESKELTTYGNKKNSLLKSQIQHGLPVNKENENQPETKELYTSGTTLKKKIKKKKKKKSLLKLEIQHGLSENDRNREEHQKQVSDLSHSAEYENQPETNKRNTSDTILNNKSKKKKKKNSLLKAHIQHSLPENNESENQPETNELNTSGTVSNNKSKKKKKKNSLLKTHIQHSLPENNESENQEEYQEQVSDLSHFSEYENQPETNELNTSGTILNNKSKKKKNSLLKSHIQHGLPENNESENQEEYQEQVSDLSHSSEYENQPETNELNTSGTILNNKSKKKKNSLIKSHIQHGLPENNESENQKEYLQQLNYLSHSAESETKELITL